MQPTRGIGARHIFGLLVLASGCADPVAVTTDRPALSENVGFATAPTFPSIVEDSLSDRRRGGEQVLWGVNVFPLTQDPYKQGAFPIAEQIALAKSLGIAAIRFPVPLRDDGTPVDADGRADVAAAVLNAVHAAAVANGLAELPTLLAPPLPEADPVAARTRAFSAVSGFLSTYPGRYPYVMIGNEYAGYDTTCARSPISALCAVNLAQTAGGVAAARASGSNPVTGDAADLWWWIDRLAQLSEYGDIAALTWNFYAGECQEAVGTPPSTASCSDNDFDFRRPSAAKWGRSLTTEFLRSGLPQLWLTEFGRDDALGQPSLERNLGAARSTGEIMRDVHGWRSPSGSYAMKAAFYFQLVDFGLSRSGESHAPRERYRGAFTCGSVYGEDGCPAPRLPRPVADTVRYWIRAFSDVGRESFVRAAVRHLGRGSADANSELVRTWAANVNTGVSGLARSVDTWLASDSVRALFVRHAYLRAFGIVLDPSIVPHQEALAHWIGCWRGVPWCLDGRPKSREWLLAEFAASEHVWASAGMNIDEYATRVADIVMYPVARDTSHRRLLIEEVRRQLLAGSPRWRAAQWAFASRFYRLNEAGHMFRAVIGRDPFPSENAIIERTPVDPINNSRFQESILSPLVRSRSFVRDAIKDGMTP